MANIIIATVRRALGEVSKVSRRNEPEVMSKAEQIFQEMGDLSQWKCHRMPFFEVILSFRDLSVPHPLACEGVNEHLPLDRFRSSGREPASSGSEAQHPSVPTTFRTDAHESVWQKDRSSCHRVN